MIFFTYKILLCSNNILLYLMLIMFRDFYLHFNTLIVFVIVLKLYQRKYIASNFRCMKYKERKIFLFVFQYRESLRLETFLRSK